MLMFLRKQFYILLWIAERVSQVLYTLMKFDCAQVYTSDVFHSDWSDCLLIPSVAFAKVGRGT